MKRKCAIGLIFLAAIAGFSCVSFAQPSVAVLPARIPAGQTAQQMLSELVKHAAAVALDKFKDKGLKESELSITLIDLRDPVHPVTASFRGNERIYPASVVKLFYLVAAHRLLQDKQIEDTPELRRALKDMIVDSSNEATQYIVDVITHTTGGYELPAKEMEEWQDKRNAVNRYFSSLGYTNINVNQKTFCEDAYGREKVSRGPNGENRNKLTTDATARLLAEIITHRAVTPERSEAMMSLLKRDYSGTSTDLDDQAHGFTALALTGIKDARLWSKAGWTSTTRHDAAYLELPNGSRFVLVTFTTDHANDREIIPTVARVVIEGIKNVKNGQPQITQISLRRETNSTVLK
jgi:beta-lactamase class A